MIPEPRLQALNERAIADGRYVLYWMQRAQRAEGNAALIHAVREANRLGLPVMVCFGLSADYPEANLRHYTFMFEGLCETARRLTGRGIAFLLRIGHPADVAVELARRAALVVCDRAYLRHLVAWREDVAAAALCPVVQVEGDVVVPVELASGKREYAARTIRPKIARVRESCLTHWTEPTVRRRPDSLDLAGGCDLADIRAVADRLGADASVPAVRRFRGGTAQARRRLARFIRTGLADYAEKRRDPADQGASMLSPYLHFGQISPIEIAGKVLAAKSATEEGREAFLEELIVRRELAVNFVRYTPDYDRYTALPDWARRTLAAHRDDERPHLYRRADFEAARTHDPYWNAAMREMKATGYMHNAMRMYWGKKVLEWSATPEAAFETALALNNKYFLDGRDPNSYANVGWCFGLHDRPWPERPIYGTVRSMSAGGLERKFDTDAYCRLVGRLEAAEAAG